MKKIIGLSVVSLCLFCMQVVAQTPGIWISRAELAALPTSGTAWNNVKSAADQSCGTVDLSNQDQSNNVCILAKALVFARTGQASYRSGTVTALQSIANMTAYSGRALALGRELGAYVVAADLIDLKNYDPVLDAKFRTKIKSLLTTPTSDGPVNLIDCHEDRPNNWGAHCGGSRAAVDAYLGDLQDMARVAQVFKGWLGDRTSYSGFSFGDLSWQCNSSAPVGVNPPGCAKSGHSIDGVLPDDQRRSGGFTWPPPQENYVYEALQGALMQAVILERAGYDAFAWEDQALLRAFRWLQTQDNYPAEGDDTWQPFLINFFYGTDFPAKTPTTPGKNMGWTDWTHSGTYAPPTGDTKPPVISNIVTSLITSSSATIMWNTDEAADTQVDYGETTTCGVSSPLNSTRATSHSAVLSGLKAGTLYYYRVKSRDVAGNLATSGNRTFTSIAAPASTGCTTSASSWKMTSFPARSGTFTAQFDATPNAVNMDGVTGISATSATGYSNLAVLVRFYTNGRIEARNGSTYAAGTAIPYTAGSTYHFRIVVRVPSHTYDVYVTSPGASEKVLGLNYMFRSETSAVTALSYWAIVAAKGSHRVCNFAIY